MEQGNRRIEQSNPVSNARNNNGPRPTHFVIRQDGTMSPLVAEDELPVGVRLTGVGSSVNPNSTFGMQSLGLAPNRGRYVLEPLGVPPAAGVPASAGAPATTATGSPAGRNSSRNRGPHGKRGHRKSSSQYSIQDVRLVLVLISCRTQHFTDIWTATQPTKDGTKATRWVARRRQLQQCSLSLVRLPPASARCRRHLQQSVRHTEQRQRDQ